MPIPERRQSSAAFTTPMMPSNNNGIGAGRLSLAGGGARQSLGPSRVRNPGNVAGAISEMADMSLNGPTGKMSHNRTSIDPRDSMNRRSSAFGKNLAGFVGGKDPRPIREKPYQLEVIKNLIGFLAKSGYPHPISQKILTAPSAKDFQNIFKFLYAQLDPGYDWGKKFEEEVPVVMKGLRYPFAGDISKRVTNHCYDVGLLAWRNHANIVTLK